MQTTVILSTMSPDIVRESLLALFLFSFLFQHRGRWFGLWTTTVVFSSSSLPPVASLLPLLLLSLLFVSIGKLVKELHGCLQGLSSFAIHSAIGMSRRKGRYGLGLGKLSTDMVLQHRKIQLRHCHHCWWSVVAVMGTKARQARSSANWCPSPNTLSNGILLLTV